MYDLVYQIPELGYLVFGVNYLKLGVNQKDRDINRRLQNYKAWGNKFVTDKVE